MTAGSQIGFPHFQAVRAETEDGEDEEAEGI